MIRTPGLPVTQKTGQIEAPGRGRPSVIVIKLIRNYIKLYQCPKTDFWNPVAIMNFSNQMIHFENSVIRFGHPTMTQSNFEYPDHVPDQIISQTNNPDYGLDQSGPTVRPSMILTESGTKSRNKIKEICYSGHSRLKCFLFN